MILDGLDEIPADLQPAALRALSQQATFRLVILSRTGEMAAAAAQSHLDGAAAVELQNVDATIAAGYLTRVQLDPPPAGWSELTGRLRRAPSSPLAQALGSPLTLGLLRDTYRGPDDVRELLGFSDSPVSASRDEIVDHLLDRVLPAAYARQPGQPPPRYDLQKAQLCAEPARRPDEPGRNPRPAVVEHSPVGDSRAADPWSQWCSASRDIAEWLLTTRVEMFRPGDHAGIDWNRSCIWYRFEIGVLFGLIFGSVLGLAFWFAVTRRHRLPRRIRLRRRHHALRRDAVRRGLVPGVIVRIGIGLVAWFETACRRRAGGRTGRGARDRAGVHVLWPWGG